MRKGIVLILLLMFAGNSYAQETAKSKYKKSEMELKVLHDEISTIEVIGNNLKREQDLEKYQ